MTDDRESLLERLFPPPHDVFIPLGYHPNPGPQTEFHQIPSYAEGGPWDVLFGGAMGGGKTLALVMDAIDKASRHKGIEVWVVRQTYPDLERDVIPHIEAMRYCTTIGGRWHGGQRTLSFPGGGKIRFLHARNKVDAANVRGECQYLLIDERTMIDPEVIDMLSLRIRSGHPSIPVIGIRSGTNPGGVGHSRMKGDFIDPAPTGRVDLPIVSDTGQPVVAEDGRPMLRWFLPSTAADNPHLDGSYYARFDMMGADARAAYRDGDWSRFEGMRFASFSMGVHVVNPSDVPLDLADLRTAAGIDYGSAAPFAAAWGALIDGGERLVVYRELHQAGLTPLQQAEAMLAVQQDVELGQPAHIDPSTWARNPEQPTAVGSPDRPPPGSIAASYLAAGVAIRKAHNDRVTGWATIDQLLADRPDGRPGMYIYDTCPNLIRSLSGAPRDPRHPEDVDGAYRDDHILDAFRYLAVGLVGGPVHRPPQLRDTGERAANRRISLGVR